MNAIISPVRRRPVSVNLDTQHHAPLTSRYYPQTIEDIDEGEVDDDPLYELYNCHKVTFLDKKIKNPQNQFVDIEFSKENAFTIKGKYKKGGLED